MALSKSIEYNNTGFLATYWVLDNVNYSLRDGQVWVTLRGYKDSAAFAAGKSYIMDRSFTAAMPPSFASITGAAQVTTIYNYIKTQPEFIGASDVA